MKTINCLFNTLAALALICGLSVPSRAQLAPPPTIPAPVFTPAGGNYTSPQTVTISVNWGILPAIVVPSIRYTTDGSTPSATNGMVYTGPITISNTTIIEAVGLETLTEYPTPPPTVVTPITRALYTITYGTVATPVLSPAGGTFPGPIFVTIADSTPGASIYYNVFANTPGQVSLPLEIPYTGPIEVGNGNYTITAYAFASGLLESAAVQGTYIVGVPPPPTYPAPVFMPPGGTYTGPQSASIAVNWGILPAIETPSIRYTTDGSTPSATNGKLYTGPVNVTTTTTINAVGILTLVQSPPPIGTVATPVAVAAYVINPVSPVAAPTFSQPSGTYTKEVHTRISDSDASASIYYTTDGSTPTSSSTPNPDNTIEFKSTTTLKSIAIDKGVSSPVTTAVYTIN
jgi:hypothetical protein